MRPFRKGDGSAIPIGRSSARRPQRSPLHSCRSVVSADAQGNQAMGLVAGKRLGKPHGGAERSLRGSVALVADDLNQAQLGDSYAGHLARVKTKRRIDGYVRQVEDDVVGVGF